jgi:DNA-binding transcriptional LysR family regulator
MELRHLRYFAAVAQALSFTRAAASLRLAQPSLSKQIRNLEDEIGVRLFDRDRNHVSLTDAGTVFFDEAKRLLDGVEDAVKFARATAEGRTGKLRIAAISPLTHSFLPASLVHFRQKYPDVDVSIFERIASDTLAGLKEGTIDLGIVFHPGFRKGRCSGFASKRLLQCPVGAIINPSHPLAGKQSLSLRDLKNETFLPIRFTDSNGHRDWMESLARSAGFKPRFGEETETPDALPGMVAAGYGVSLVAKLYEWPASPAYLFRTLSDSDLKFELHAVWIPGSTSIPLNNFLEILGGDIHALQNRE